MGLKWGATDLNSTVQRTLCIRNRGERPSKSINTFSPLREDLISSNAASRWSKDGTTTALTRPSQCMRYKDVEDRLTWLCSSELNKLPPDTSDYEPLAAIFRFKDIFIPVEKWNRMPSSNCVAKFTDVPRINCNILHRKTIKLVQTA